MSSHNASSYPIQPSQLTISQSTGLMFPQNHEQVLVIQPTNKDSSSTDSDSDDEDFSQNSKTHKRKSTEHRNKNAKRSRNMDMSSSLPSEPNNHVRYLGSVNSTQLINNILRNSTDNQFSNLNNNCLSNNNSNINNTDLSRLGQNVINTTNTSIQNKDSGIPETEKQVTHQNQATNKTPLLKTFKRSLSSSSSSSSNP